MNVTDNRALAFGPVPSRRLGQSLGINNIPPKSCSYSCVYCQVGVTRIQEIERREFFSPQLIYDVVRERLVALREHQQHVDYLTFVPDGEPTLDINLGTTIELLQSLELPVAVISNASLLWQADVRGDLTHADFVSLKIDSTDETAWRRINRPHSQLTLPKILHGIKQFAEKYNGTLGTETMLVKGVNDNEEMINQVADFIQEVSPDTAYIAIPTRPPAEPDTRPADPATIVKAHEIFSSRAINTELLITEKAGEFGITGDIEQDLVNTAAVHPLSEQAVSALLKKAGVESSLLSKLVRDNRLVAVQYAEKVFYVPPGRQTVGQGGKDT
jgi:wyosine [tRNA(Phe)-imidazoG37] synthetase (radical SAM superfamily)